MKKRICIILSAILAALSIAAFPVSAVESEDYVQGQAIACIETKTGLVQSNSANGLEWESLMELDSEGNEQPEMQAQNGKFAGIPSGAAITGGETVRELVLVTSSSMSTNALINKLEKRDDVLFAEPNYIKLSALPTPRLIIRNCSGDLKTTVLWRTVCPAMTLEKAQT